MSHFTQPARDLALAARPAVAGLAPSPAFASVAAVAAVAVAAALSVVGSGCGGSPPPPPAPPSSGHAHWSYSGMDGPERWGDLDAAYALCKTGEAQSPIELPSAPAHRGAYPGRPRWEPVPIHIVNNGHTVQVDDAAPSELAVDGVSYRLAQFHFHSPAEHSVGGRTYDLEMHLVHKSDDGKLLVVGLLFSRGNENKALAGVWSAMPAHEGPAVSAPGAPVDVAALLPASPRYLRYSGSLTAPPCTEGVTWLVVEPDPSTQLSAEQIQKFRDATQPSTNRPRQAIGAREVVELVP